MQGVIEDQYQKSSGDSDIDPVKIGAAISKLTEKHCLFQNASISLWKANEQKKGFAFMEGGKNIEIDPDNFSSNDYTDKIWSTN